MTISVHRKFRCGYLLGHIKSSSSRFSQHCSMHVHHVLFTMLCYEKLDPVTSSMHKLFPGPLTQFLKISSAVCAGNECFGSVSSKSVRTSNIPSPSTRHPQGPAPYWCIPLLSIRSPALVCSAHNSLSLFALSSTLDCSCLSSQRTLSLLCPLVSCPQQPSDKERSIQTSCLPIMVTPCFAISLMDAPPRPLSRSEGVDPFMDQKMLGVTSALTSMEALAKRLLATDVSTAATSTNFAPMKS